MMHNLVNSSIFKVVNKTQTPTTTKAILSIVVSLLMSFFIKEYCILEIDSVFS